MYYLKQLDDVLEFLDDGDRPATVHLSIKIKFKEILDNHLYLILDKLIDDGYVIYEEGSKSRYQITYDGLMFLGSGGYMAQNNRNQRQYRRQFILDRALIFGSTGALIAGLYALWNMLNDIYGVYYPCYCY